MDQGRVLEAERLTHAMETTRARILGTVEELRENVHRSIDWREQVKAHPAAALAAAATGAMLVGRWLGARMSARAPRPDAAPPGASVPLLNGPLSRAGSRVSDLVNRVIDELGDTVERAAVPPLIARVQSFLQSGPGGGRAPAGRGEKPTVPE